MLEPTVVRQLHRTLRDSIDNNEIAGANVMVLKDGSEVFYHEDGLADREAGLPITRSSIFRLYSMTKPVTAASVMLLLERGVIDLFDPVSKFLPGFKNQKVEKNGVLVPVEREANIQDLLNMTSGLVYPGGDNQAGKQMAALFEELDRRLLGETPLSTWEVTNRLGECPLAFQPGSYWQYGTSADVLGAVVEVASGMKFGEFLRQELFEPLGMKDTGFWVPEEKRSRLAKTYANTAQGDLEIYAGNHLGIVHQMDREPAFESGGAGLVSTVEDYAKFASMLIRQGSLDGKQILRPRTVRYLTTGKLTDAQQKALESWHTMRGYSYSNQMRILQDSTMAGTLGSTGEYGWDGWLGPYFCNFPSDGLTFLFMIQKKDAGTMTITRKLRNIVLSAF